MTIMVILNKVISEKDKYLSSQRGIAKLIWVVMGGGAFSNPAHLWTIIEERRDDQKDREVTNETKIKGLV